MSEIIWDGYQKDRKSRDGRWHIRHPSTTPSKKWELYDMKAGRWCGDWPTCKAAKAAAQREVYATTPVAEGEL